jgi:hypothetical protein
MVYYFSCYVLDFACKKSLLLPILLTGKKIHMSIVYTPVIQAYSLLVQIKKSKKLETSTGSPQLIRVCFETIHNNDGFETRRPKISRNYKKVQNYKHRICCKETAQPIRDESYPHVLSKPIRDEVAGKKRRGTLSSLVGVLLLGHYSAVSINKTRATMSSKRSAGTSSEK